MNYHIVKLFSHCFYYEKDISKDLQITTAHYSFLWARLLFSNEKFNLMSVIFNSNTQNLPDSAPYVMAMHPYMPHIAPVVPIYGK